MRTGILTTSFPRHPGDFAGCFVEDAARAYAAAGDTVEVIAAGPSVSADAEFSEGGESARQRRCERWREPDGRRDGDGPRRREPITRTDLPESITLWRVETPVPPGSRPLFFGDGAPEALEASPAGAWVQAALFWAGLCERLRERAPSWDRISAHWLLPSALAARAVAPGLPLTAYAHSGDVALLERLPGGDAISRKLARETNDLVFVSANLRERFARLTGLPGRPPGRVARLQPPRYLPSPASEDGPPSPRGEREDGTSAGENPRPQRSTVISVGRLVPIKGFDILLRAVAAAQWQTAPEGVGPRMKVVVLGEGPERPRLQRMARAMEIDLLLPGAVPRHEVASWLSFARIYVQPSLRLPNGRTEGTPLSTLEALEIGLPVIASSTGGLSELRGDGLRLVPPGDVKALAACLREESGRADMG